MGVIPLSLRTRRTHPHQGKLARQREIPHKQKGARALRSVGFRDRLPPPKSPTRPKQTGKRDEKSISPPQTQSQPPQPPPPSLAPAQAGARTPPPPLYQILRVRGPLFPPIPVTNTPAPKPTPQPKTPPAKYAVTQSPPAETNPLHPRTPLPPSPHPHPHPTPSTQEPPYPHPPIPIPTQPPHPRTPLPNTP